MAPKPETPFISIHLKIYLTALLTPILLYSLLFLKSGPKIATRDLQDVACFQGRSPVIQHLFKKQSWYGFNIELQDIPTSTLLNFKTIITNTNCATLAHFRKFISRLTYKIGALFWGPKTPN